jgi:GH15 family glucan-1,4-alpha-glucosidase
MVLETTFRCGAGEVRLTDALTVGTNGPLPWSEVARRVEAVEGDVPMHWAVRPGHRLGTRRPWAQCRGGVPVIRSGDVHLAVVTDGVGGPEILGGQVAGSFVATPGATGLLAVVATSDEPLQVPEAAAVQGRLDRTVEHWRRWCTDVRYDGPHADAVRRSALTLKALTIAPQAGIASAMTTSLPERIGGKRNFDYRFGWVRDASFALDAMSRLGLSEEVHAALSWLLRAVGSTAPRVRTMYTLEGSPASAEMGEVETVPGYRGSRPVHVGNSAAAQLQLGAFGDLLDAVWRYTRNGGWLEEEGARTVADIADRACDLWRRKDAGIWELGDQEHYTISKIGCWVALDRAVRLSEAGQVVTPHPDRWRAEREAVRRWTDEHCWSPTKRSYTFHAGTDELDAAVLLAARTRYLSPDDDRLHSTIDAIRAELGAGGPLLYRYSGMAEQEGAFLACTFWLVEALAHAGRTAEAADVLDEALGYAGTSGLFSEEVDPQSGELLGNLPQGLTHLSVIGAITGLHRNREHT